MSQTVSTRNVSSVQSTLDIQSKTIFLFDNRYTQSTFTNTTGAEFTLKAGMLVVRNAGTYESASVQFSATPLSAGQTVILGGLTYTSTGVTTTAQLAAAFANLLDGATTGAGTATGTYGGALSGFTTDGVVGLDTVVFTAVAVGNTTDLAQTGTGAASTITIVQGSAAVADGIKIATAGNLADVVGIATVGNDPTGIVLPINQDTATNFCHSGTVNGNNLILPAGVSLTTIVGNKTVLDILNGLGLDVQTNISELTNFDN
jgi:hypothetical protein